MLPNERAHQITIVNMFWYSISVYINLLWAFSRNLRYSFQIAGFHLKPFNCDRLQRSRNLKLVSFWRADTAVIFWTIKEHLVGISRNIESNLLKTLGENCEKSTFFPKITHLSMELELVIGTIRKGHQKYYLNAYIDLRYRLSGKS